MKKTFIFSNHFIILLILLVCFIPNNISAQGTISWVKYAQPFPSGNGSKSSPFLIEKPEHLAFVAIETQEGRNFLGQFLLITKDIDLSGKEWSGIGSLVSATSIFCGTIDGGGHVIKNLVINNPEGDYIGLFGCSMGFIENLGIEDCNIIGKEYVGGLIGFAYEGTVKNCYVTGNVEGKANRVGLLSGQNDGVVTDCHTSGNIEGKEHVGGLVGLNYGSIINSRSSGNVKGSNQIGGLIGLVQKGRISNCKSDCIVEAIQENAGGLIGQNNGTLVNCQVSGKVTGRAYIGGLAGWNYYGSVENCSASGNVKGTMISGGLIGSSETDKPLIKCFATGNVEGTEGYIGGLIGMNNGPVSDSYATGKITGKTYLGGLIGNNSAGKISECYATGIVEGSEDRIGGLIGKSSDAVNKCFATGGVKGRNLIGGLIGTDKESCTFSDCYATGNVSGTGIYIGGLLGQSLGIILNCYASGAVSGNQYIGGLVGAVFGSLKNSVAANQALQITSNKFGERILGEPGENAVIENNYALNGMQINSKPQTAGGKANHRTGIDKALPELYLLYTYQSELGWDFNNTWSIQEGAGLPTFKLKSPVQK